MLSVSEKLPVYKLRYFWKYITQLYGYFYVHVSAQWLTDLEIKQFHKPWNYGACDFYVFRSI